MINLTTEVADAAWVKYWKIYLVIHMAVSVVVIIWFTIGGIFDLKAMFRRLKALKRDERDDGFVRRGES